MAAAGKTYVPSHIWDDRIRRNLSLRTMSIAVLFHALSFFLSFFFYSCAYLLSLAPSADQGVAGPIAYLEPLKFSPTPCQLFFHNRLPLPYSSGIRVPR